MRKRKGSSDINRQVEAVMESASHEMMEKEVKDLFYSIIKSRTLTEGQVVSLANRLKKTAVPLAALRKSPEGKVRIISIDKFTGDVKLEGEFDDPQVAIRIAREMTRKGQRGSVSYDDATIYCAYDSNGTYLGGDIWVEE